VQGDTIGVLLEMDERFGIRLSYFNSRGVNLTSQTLYNLNTRQRNELDKLELFPAVSFWGSSKIKFVAKFGLPESKRLTILNRKKSKV
jgi:hypothetical protein